MTDIDDRTMVQWLVEPPADRGLHFAAPRDGWTDWSYQRLAELALRTAGALRDRGLRGPDVVAVILPSSPGFVASLFGTFAAGLTACSIAPSFAFRRADEYERRLGEMLRAARPALVVCDADSAASVRRAAEAVGVPAPVLFEELIAGVDPVPVPEREPGGLLQFTSGSSGAPRGVLIPATSLQANVTAMRRWLEWSPELPGISWLPVHHDMGLIGCLANIVVTGCDGWMLQPEDFIRSPLRYLRCISDQQVGLAAMPNFGLAYILRRVRRTELEGLRFDSLRSVILGAERIDPQVLRDFHTLLGPYGFDHRALLPAYGGAEATLAVTGLPLREGWTAAAPDTDGDGPSDGGGDAEVTGCGRPLDGVEVLIVDEDGTPLPDGRVGEIQVRSAALASGYTGDPGSASGTALAGDLLRSGDAGFLRDGQLFVIGRIGDGLKVRGGMVFAESLEEELVRRGIPERRVAVLLGVHEGRATGVVAMEAPGPGWAALAAEVLREQLDDAGLLAAVLPRGGIAVTSSGKPRRRVMWQDFGAGRLSTAPLQPVPVPA
ncbi:AMP-binding protein [Streptacidiphilus sp. N1-12]|uniref:AMP-binding protein n=2 Tax=Streptacidiphilus alkalitolerans TaxID=3342712 RepID=A0ABV6VJY2_9ACTN